MNSAAGFQAALGVCLGGVHRPNSAMSASDRGPAPCSRSRSRFPFPDQVDSSFNTAAPALQPAFPAFPALRTPCPLKQTPAQRCQGSQLQHTAHCSLLNRILRCPLRAAFDYLIWTACAHRTRGPTTTGGRAIAPYSWRHVESRSQFNIDLCSLHQFNTQSLGAVDGNRSVSLANWTQFHCCLASVNHQKKRLDPLWPSGADT